MLENALRLITLLLLPMLLATGDGLADEADTAADTQRADIATDAYRAGLDAYMNGDYKQALKILTPLAEDGNSEAQKMLGIIYDYGHGVRANKDKAMQWYLRAANQGHPVVQYQVGAKYYRGDGVEQDIGEAASWWELAANGGDAEAQFNLGLLYFRGLDVEQNDARAADFFRKAAEQGHSYAQYSLAVVYALGRGVEQDYARALGWFEKSADQGIAQAQFNLGVFYENGYAVEADPALARQWYQRAAEQDVSEAIAKLAELGITTDPAPAQPASKPGQNQEAIVHPDDVQAERLVSTATAVESTEVYNPATTQPGPIYEQPLAAPTTTPAATDSAAEQTLAAARPASTQARVDSRQSAAGEEAAMALRSALENAAWVRGRAADHYTVQLGSVSQEKNIIRLINENNISAQATYVKVNINGEMRYNALYGVYPSQDEARQAIKTLPENLQRNTWVRNFGLLQKLLAE